jgi:hypothetical protein
VDACVILGFLGAFFFVFFLVANAGRSPPSLTFAPNGMVSGGGWSGPADWKVSSLSKGVPARGILLNVAISGSRTRHRGQRYEIRTCRIDVEPSGFAPYEVTANVYIPSTLVRDALPGSTLEVRVDSGDLQNVLVIGPDVGYAQGSVRTAS